MLWNNRTSRGLTLQYTLRLLYVALTLFALTACSHTTPAQSEWTTLTLPNNWTLQAPDDFTVEVEQGIDSQPGSIVSSGIELSFDSGQELVSPSNEDCSFSAEVERIKKSIERGEYTGYYYSEPIDYKAQLITNGEQAAVIIAPTEKVAGKVRLIVKDCQTASWLGIGGKKLTAKQIELVLQVFRTIQFDRH